MKKVINNFQNLIQHLPGITIKEMTSQIYTDVEVLR